MNVSIFENSIKHGIKVEAGINGKNLKNERTKFMGKKSLLVIAIIFIFQTKIQASEVQDQPSYRRINLNLSIKLRGVNYDKTSDGEPSTEEKILNELKTREIEFDSKTTINIHEEGDKVDFSCFDCIVRELSPNESAFSAWNGRQMGL